MSLAVIFGSNLRNCRKARHLTQAELAEKVSLSTEMISKIERGVASPSFSNVEKISEALAISETDLFNADLIATVGGERSQVLSKIQIKLSRLSNDQLVRVDKILSAFID